MKNIEYKFTNGEAKISTPPYNEQEALAFWSTYDTPSISLKDDKSIEVAEVEKSKNISDFGKMLGAITKVPKPKEDK